MKKEISEKQVEYVALLAALPLTKEQQKKFCRQLSEVIEFNISLLEKVNTEKVAPLAHVLGVVNQGRDDIPEPGLTQEEALQNTKSGHNGFFKIKAILEKDL